jgi:hypothetical protein
MIQDWHVFDVVAQMQNLKKSEKESEKNLI